MKRIIITLYVCTVAISLSAQKYFTRDGVITFNSSAVLETINATNDNASSVIDATSGALEWAVLIKAFAFEKALMQEHFNENYMESSKYPKAVFKGKINESVDWTTDGTYEVPVSGALTIHGVTNDINTTATLNILKGQIIAASTLTVLVKDYNIKIPSVVKDNIAKEVTIDISATYQLLPE